MDKAKLQELLVKRIEIELSGLPDGPTLIPALTALIAAQRANAAERHALGMRQTEVELKTAQAASISAFRNPESLMLSMVYDATQARVAGNDKAAEAYEKGIELLKSTLKVVDEEVDERDDAPPKSFRRHT